MAYRNGTYVAFHAGGTTDPTKSDIKYYNALKMWSANEAIELSFIDSHEKTAAIRDSSKTETLRRALITRLANSKQFFLIVTGSTRLDTDWVPFEIRKAIDTYQLPVIAAYPDYTSILQPSALAGYWPAALAARIRNGSARVIHIPFRKDPVIDALGQFDLSKSDYPTDGYGYYSEEAHRGWGLL